MPGIFVIARNSTFTYKGKPAKAQKVAEDLGVRYMLEGSAQRSGDKVRMTAQLIDALKGHHIMSERLERSMKEIFALQDDLTRSIISAVQAKLTMGNGARLLAKGTANIEAYLKFLEASELLFRFTKDANLSAQRRLEEVIALDPEYPSAYGVLSNVYVMDMVYGFSPKESIDDTLGGAHGLLGNILIMKKEYEEGVFVKQKGLLSLSRMEPIAQVGGSQVTISKGASILRF